MLRLYSHQVVYKEVPDEISLALSFSGCPKRCEGCHSQELWDGSLGEKFTVEMLRQLCGENKYITCVLFYGGEWDNSLPIFLKFVQRELGLKCALYSGENSFDYISDRVKLYTDYLKLGEYKKEKGGIEVTGSNQKMYKRVRCGWEDITGLFRITYPNKHL